MTLAHDIFYDLWKTLERIDYQPSWANGTGYLDGATKMAPPTAAAFIDDKQRKGILIPCKGGSLVVFERYSDGDKGVLVSNDDVYPGLFVTALSDIDMRIVERIVARERVPAHLIHAASNAHWGNNVEKERELRGTILDHGFQIDQ